MTLHKAVSAQPHIASIVNSAAFLLKPDVSMVSRQALANALKAREDAASANEQRLDAEVRSLQQQRQELELAGMKAQLAVQQQQQQQPSALLSPVLSPLLQAAPQLGGIRTTSRLQVSCQMRAGIL